jgi:hypothetical protein
MLNYSIFKNNLCLIKNGPLLLCSQTGATAKPTKLTPAPFESSLKSGLIRLIIKPVFIALLTVQLQQ